MTSLRRLLNRGGPLRESRPLFRFLAREIIFGLRDIHRMTTFRLLEAPTVDNVFLGDAGVSVWLGNLQWGEEVRGKDVDGYQDGPLSFYARRERERERERE